jgi:hypothetical protein
MGAADGQQPDGGTPSDSVGGSDAPTGCAISIDPIDPVASPVLPIRAYTTVLNESGLVTFTWTVSFGSTPVPFTEQAADGSQIGFVAPTQGIYRIRVDITNAPGCFSAERTVNVAAPGANADVFRLRTVPSPSLAPPQETFVQVKGGANLDRTIALDSGIAVNGLVRNSATSANVAAYLKFMPRSMPTAFTELFASASTGYQLRLLPLDHDVLVVPASTGLAPKLVRWTAVPLTAELFVGPGTVVTGTVRGPGGAGFGGAIVQLYAGGVPSTLATTAADGSYSVRTDFPSGATQVTVKVTPPAASGLPRLEATSAFNLAAALDVTYAASLQTCNLGGTPVRRASANQANARVSVVGTLAGVAGAINGVNATNTVRVTATANGSGVLPAMLVPRGPLSAVSELSMTDHAITAIDTSACSVASINAPAMTTIAGTTRYPNMNLLAGIRVDAEPIGELALAGVPPVQVVSNGSAAFALPLAGGGRYNVRFSDPQQRVAPLVADDVAPGGVPTNALLVQALSISGPVTVVSNGNPVVGASVQILCAMCSGLELMRPIAETATTSVSRYAIAVPDPGTM